MFLVQRLVLLCAAEIHVGVGSVHSFLFNSILDKFKKKTLLESRGVTCGVFSQFNFLFVSLLNFLARATVGTSLYVLLSSVSQSVS